MKGITLLAAAGMAAWLSFGSAQAETVLLYSGPPPSEGGISIRWTPPGTDRHQVNAIFEIFGSARLTSGTVPRFASDPHMIGICLRVDGVDCYPKSNAKMWANVEAAHMELAPAIFPVQAAAGVVFAGLVVPMDSGTTKYTTWDGNDQITVLVTW